MFTRKTTGILAASLTAGALLTMPFASAAPTWTHIQNIGVSGAMPDASTSAVADNGDVVVAWLRGDRVMAASAKHGVFGPAYYVSEATDVATRPSVAINNHGDAVVVWVQDDTLGHARLTGNRRNADGTFQAGFNYLSKAAEQDVEGTAPRVALQENGTARIAYTSTDGADVHQVRVTTWAEGALTATTATVSDSSAGYPDIAVNGPGTVQVAWSDLQDGGSQIKTRRLPAGVNVWGLTKIASPVDGFGPDVQVALSDSGTGTIATTRHEDFNYRVVATKLSTDGTPGSATYVSAADAMAGEISLDQNDAGTALLAWVQTKDGEKRVAQATRPLAGAWTTGLIAKAVDAPYRPLAGIAENGTLFVGYTGDDRMLASYQVNNLLPWELYSSGDIDADAPSTLGGVDDEGNIFLGAIVREADPTKGHGVARFLDSAGAHTSLSKPSQFTIGTKPAVAWSATDRLSGVGDTDVMVSTVSWNGNFDPDAYAAQHDADGKLTYVGHGGRTYCFKARTRDAVGNTGAFSDERCTTTPIDDVSFDRVSGFKRVSSTGAYAGAYSGATKKGATLQFAGVHASRLALLVSKVSNGGTIEVYFHGDKLGSYNLAGSGNKKIVDIATLDSVESGTVVIKVVSADGKSVRIDGLFAIH